MKIRDMSPDLNFDHLPPEGEAELPVLVVTGPHSSGTRIHTALAMELAAHNELQLLVQHWSLPTDHVYEGDLYVFVQRDAEITHRSALKRGYGRRSRVKNGTWTSQKAQVWEGIAQFAEFASDPSLDDRVLHVWYDETVRWPRFYAQNLLLLLQKHGIAPLSAEIPPHFGHQVVDGSAKYRDVVSLTEERQ